MPTANLEAEEVVLGSLLIDPAALDELDLKPHEFFSERNQLILKAMLSIRQNGGAVDLLTLCDWLEARKLEVSPVYISSLLETVPTSLHVHHYAKLVRNAAIRQALTTAGTNIVQLAYNESLSIEEVINKAEGAILSLDVSHSRDSTADGIMSQMFSDFITPNDSTIGRIFTGLNGIDRNLLGIEDGRFWLMAAVPETGKSSLSINMARGACGLMRQDVAILYFHPEQPEEEITTLLLSSGTETVTPTRIKMLRTTKTRREEYAKLLNNGLNTGNLTDEELKDLRLSQASLYNKSFSLCDPSSIDIFGIRSRIRRERTKLHPDTFLLVIIDGLHLISGAGEGNRVGELTTITRNCKVSAMNDVRPGAIIANHQLNRLLYSDSKGGPRVYSRHHLRDSGSLEQDADVILFLDRPSVFEECGVCNSKLQPLYVGGQRLMGCPQGHNITGAWDPFSIICKKNRQTSKHFKAELMMNKNTMKVKDGA